MIPAALLALFLAQSQDLKFETSDFLRHSAYRNVAKLNPDSAPSGAYGPVNRAWDETHTGNWYIEEQRYGSDLVSGGIATKNREAIERGLKIFEWGFAQQQSDGGFRCPDAFHSTSFFVEAVAHSLLMLEQSGDKDFRETAAAMKLKLLAAARWMTNPENEVRGRKNNAPYTHRRYLVAAALGQAGVLLHDKQLVERSAEYIREGVGLQDAAGFNPERGGYDSSYNAVGIFYAERYYENVASAELRQAMYKSIENAIRWEASRVVESGEVQTEGNTRVGSGREEKGRSGKTKTVAYGTVYRAFEYWSIISGDRKYSGLAKRVAIFAKQWRV
jgi:hypothetical protein